MNHKILSPMHRECFQHLKFIWAWRARITKKNLPFHGLAMLWCSHGDKLVLIFYSWGLPHFNVLITRFLILYLGINMFPDFSIIIWSLSFSSNYLYFSQYYVHSRCFKTVWLISGESSPGHFSEIEVFISILLSVLLDCLIWSYLKYYMGVYRY